MNEIICPSCSKAFKIDESGYADIKNQVRDKSFKEDLDGRIKQVEQNHKNILELSTNNAKNDTQEIISEMNTKYQILKEQLSASETEKNLAVNQAVTKIEKEKTDLINRIAQAEFDKINTSKNTELSLTNKIQEISTTKDKEIQDLNAVIDHKEDEIVYLRDSKDRLSTKMVGETLEQHCNIKFDEIRAVAFPRATFNKDNDSEPSGTKGDFIFRDYDEDGTLIVSIMFEMKNEVENTVNKKKNEEFLSKLDKDRTTKKCDYAVLVSLLERKSELYNSGIVDKSHLYPKMYVVRPQSFIAIISLLRNAAMVSLEDKKEIALFKNQNRDITNFEENLTRFKDGFGKNYELASTQHQKAIVEIDKSIDHLEKTKKALLSTDRQLRLANDKVQDVSIKKLTKNSPTMQEKFDDLA